MFPTDFTAITLPYAITNRSRMEAYDWLVIEDPSGYFTGQLFRSSDIAQSFDRWIPIGWDSGTVFQHIHTAERRIVENGNLRIDFHMVGNCSEGWRLYHTWCNESNQAQQAGQDPDKSAFVKEALKQYRKHLASCPECKSAIHKLFALGER